MYVNSENRINSIIHKTKSNQTKCQHNHVSLALYEKCRAIIIRLHCFRAISSMLRWFSFYLSICLFLCFSVSLFYSTIFSMIIFYIAKHFPHSNTISVGLYLMQTQRIYIHIKNVHTKSMR